MNPMATHDLGPTRAKVLDLLQQSREALTATDVAEELGIHPNSARHHLGELVEAGYVERTKLPTHSTGRPKVGFTPSGRAPTVSDSHLVNLASNLLEHFFGHDPRRARSVGHQWGEQLAESGADLEEVVAALTEAGFAPEVQDDTLIFSRCPFRTRMEAGTLRAVCELHLGYLRGALPHCPLGQLNIGQICTISTTDGSAIAQKSA